MKAYITAAAAISPQNPRISEWAESAVKPVGGVLACIEPSYSGYLDPRASRRMSRIMKMGLASALMCLEKSNIRVPDAILTATGLGCLEDTAAFISKLSHEEGQFLNPTAFIQSTHNTVAGAIALQLKCNSYNNTFSQRGFSFESALTEALLLLIENQSQNILLGGIDETIEPLHLVLKQFRKLKASNNNMVAIGEGASFFMLSGQPAGDASVEVSFKSFYKPSQLQLASDLNDLIEQEGIPDLILSGTNGNVVNDKEYQWINSILPDVQKTEYKQFCGEYPTASAFAHWMAYSILTDRDNSNNSQRKILIYNQSEGRNYSFTFLSKC